VDVTAASVDASNKSKGQGAYKFSPDIFRGLFPFLQGPAPLYGQSVPTSGGGSHPPSGPFPRKFGESKYSRDNTRRKPIRVRDTHRCWTGAMRQTSGNANTGRWVNSVG
jgi:hypothetical protein